MKFHIKCLTLLLLFLLFILVLINEYYLLIYGQSLFTSLGTPNTLTSSELEWLKKRGSLKYGETYDALPPKQKEGLEQHQGYSIDLITMMSVDMKIPISFIMLQWKDMLAALDDGVIDFTNLSYTPERAEKYLLSKPLYKTKGTVLVRDEGGGKLHALAQLEGMTVAAITNDHVIEALANRIVDLDIRYCEDMVECVSLLVDGQVDAIAGDEMNIMYSVHKDALYRGYSIIPEPAYIADAVMAVRRSEPELLHIINKVISILEAEDSLDKVMQKWFVSSLHVNRTDERSKYLLFAIAALGMIGFITAFFSIINAETKSLVRKRTAELDQSTKRLETTLNAIPSWLIEVDADKRIVGVNRKFVRDNPLASEEMGGAFGCPLARFFNSPELTGMIDQVFAERRNRMREVRVNSRIYDVSCSPIEVKSESDRVLVVMEDVTKARVAEKQVIQSSKMATIGQLAAGISHELRNPLGLIRNGNYILKNGIGNPEEIDQTYRMIEEAVASADTMVESLLRYSHPSPEEPLEVDLREIIETILKLRKKQFAQKGITVAFTCSGTVSITCKPDGIKSIVNNLLSNAEQAMPSGGRLRIRCRQRQDRVSLCVVDNGGGIAEENRERLFTPFFTTKPIGDGTGLGLYIVYNHVKEHGGDIAVHSKPGKTVFHITLPRETTG